MSKTNKIAIITGGGSGIGREMTLLLASKGIIIYIIGRRAEKLAETAKLAGNGNVITITADIANEVGRKTVLDATEKANINYLIHNAGTASPLKTLLEGRC